MDIAIEFMPRLFGKLDWGGDCKLGLLLPNWFIPSAFTLPSSGFLFPCSMQRKEIKNEIEIKNHRTFPRITRHQILCKLMRGIIDGDLFYLLLLLLHKLVQLLLLQLTLHCIRILAIDVLISRSWALRWRLIAAHLFAPIISTWDQFIWQIVFQPEYIDAGQYICSWNRYKWMVSEKKKKKENSFHTQLSECVRSRIICPFFSQKSKSQADNFQFAFTQQIRELACKSEEKNQLFSGIKSKNGAAITFAMGIVTINTFEIVLRWILSHFMCRPFAIFVNEKSHFLSQIRWKTWKFTHRMHQKSVFDSFY